MGLNVLKKRGRYNLTHKQEGLITEDCLVNGQKWEYRQNDPPATGFCSKMTHIFAGGVSKNDVYPDDRIFVGWGLIDPK